MDNPMPVPAADYTALEERVEVSIEKDKKIIVIGAGDFSYPRGSLDNLTPTLRNRKVINVGTPGHKDYGNGSLSMDFTTTEARVLEKFFKDDIVAPRSHGRANPHAKKKRKQQKLARRANRR